MVNVERILCPVDFSEASRYAVEHAVEAARRWNAQITIVHVHSVVVPWGPVPGVHGDVPVLPAPSLEELTEEVHRFYGMTRADIVLTTGSPAREIVRLAEEIDADLLLMGTHGHGGFDRVMLGSVTGRVLRTTRTPVLTVSAHIKSVGANAVRYATILCAVDFSAASMRAVQYAFAFAAESAAKVILLHVVEGISDLPRATAHFHLPEYGAYLVQDAKAQLAAAVVQTLREQYQVDDEVVVGKSHREILRVASEAHADLIVMGVHGQSATDRWFGSTTSHVTREADCAVLTVRADTAPAAGADFRLDEGKPS